MIESVRMNIICQDPGDGSKGRHHWSPLGFPGSDEHWSWRLAEHRVG